MLKYSAQIKLRESDFDYTDHLKLSTYFDLFQTAACEHADEHGIGFEQSIAKGIIWVITKLKLEVYKNFKVGDTITLESFPHPKGVVEYVRDYYIYNVNGELCAKGCSQWILLDANTRKILRPCFDFVGEHTSVWAYEKRIEKVSPVEDEKIGEYLVDRLDLDHNGHVNNIRYADMVFCFEKDITKPVTFCVINFLSECMLGDRLEIFTDNQGSYTGKRDQTIAFTAKIIREDYNP